MWIKGLALGPEAVTQGSLLGQGYCEFMATGNGALESAQVNSLLDRKSVV